MSSIRVRTRLKDGITTVRAIIRHPMETGFRTDPETQAIVPAHYIKLLTIRHNDDIVMSCDWSRAVSKNPYLSFEFSGASAGDRLMLEWLDTDGSIDRMTTVIE